MPTVRVMTYNILEGARDRLDVVAAVVRDAGPDVLGVTEANGLDDAKRMTEVEEAFGMKGVLGRAASGYHVAIFVKPPWQVESSGPEYYPFFHAALWAKLRFDQDRFFTAVVAHLNPFSPNLRLAEVRALCRHAVPGERAVLMGDFNCMAPGDDVDPSVLELPRNILARFVKEAGDPIEFDRRELALAEWAGFVDVYRKTHPKKPGWTLMTTRYGAALRARMRIDYLLATPRVAQRAVSAEVIETNDSRRASDHYPLMAAFDFSTTSAGAGTGIQKPEAK
ncbi:MAG: endonuclease/exonuclease/phosphatase family protein [Planctomycetes bacterium]|nr:endonuclease/exonuclease/phosphatase family protein [Planctomycetota bacterium]